MAYAFIASDCSLESSSQVTTEDFISRSVVVKNLSPATKAEDVTIHFQRRRNGGGEVECVRLLKKGTAVVTFEKSEVAASVLERQHEIDGSLVTLELYRYSIPDQVFDRVTGRLDPNIFGESKSTMKTILQTIQDETAVKWKEVFDGFVVSGTFEQIKSVNDILKTKLKGKLQNDVFYSLAVGHPAQRRKSSIEPKKRPTFDSEKIRVKSNQGYRKVKGNTYPNESDLTTNIPIPETQVSGDSVPSSEYSTDPSKRLLSVSDKAHKKRNQNYGKVKSHNACHKENEINANIPISENESKVIRDALPLLKSKVSDIVTNKTNDETQNNEETKKNCDVKITVNNIEHDKRNSNNPNSQLPHEIRRENNSNVRDLQSKPKSLDVIKSEDKSDSILPACSQEQVEKPKTVGCNTNSAVLLKGRQERSSVGGSCHKFATVTGLAVLLLKGDITSQDVDVLLNPINPTLCCEKGLSKLIVEKGGQAIKDEYLSMTQNQAPLKDGCTFITAGGNLPCRSVLHAVLPSWNNENQDDKKYKREIHRCLKNGLMLSSGYRHKSIALPPLGQDWNDIPVEVSVEVIVRVIAAFGKNVSPMHSGINEFRIVCEDDTALNVFLKNIRWFSFHEGQPFFERVSSKSNLDAEQSGAHSASHSMIRNENEGEIVDSCMPKESSVKQIQKAPATPKSASIISVTHADGPTVATQVSAPHLSETTVKNEKTPAGYSATEICSSSQFYSTPHKNQVNQDSKNGQNKDSTPSDEKQAWEKTIFHVSSSSVERIDVAEIKPFEMLQVTSAVQLGEERMKSMVVQDEPHLAGCESSELFVGNHLNLNQEKQRAGRGRSKSLQNTMVKITQEMAHDIQKPQLKDFLPRKDQDEDSRVTHSGALLITSPTVDGLLNADIRPSLQSLQLWHEEHLEDRFRRTENAKDIQDDSIENTSFLSIQELEENSRETSGVESTLRTHLPIEKTPIKEKEQEESVKRDGLVKTQKNGDKVVNGDHHGSEPNVLERDVSILCVLCQDAVDHPELTHPNVCMKHKFCDDCIIKAFTISSICPACMDTAGLITTGKRTVNHNQHIHSSSPSSRNHRNQDKKSPSTRSPDLTQGNQPPGQMMWKRYETSLPGFQGYGTIAVTFAFYDGIQGLEHPNPGRVYKGTSCVAYIPDTLEGKQALKLLRKSFDARLVFTVLSSAADGTGYITLNDIELKTNVERDSRNGYPDEGYLSRLQNQLAAKGIC